MKLSAAEIAYLVDSYRDGNPRTSPMQRKGQALFNTLAYIHPKLADEIRGTEFDPFYDNGKIPKFWEFLLSD